MAERLEHYESPQIITGIGSLPMTCEAKVCIEADLIDGPMEFIIGQNDLSLVDLSNRYATLSCNSTRIAITQSDDAICIGSLVQTRLTPIEVPSTIRRKLEERMDVPISTINVINRLIESGISSMTLIKRNLESWKLSASPSVIQSLIDLHNDVHLMKAKQFRTVKHPKQPHNKLECGFQDVSNLPVIGVFGHRYLSTIKYYDQNNSHEYCFRTMKHRAEILQHTAKFLFDHPDCKAFRTDNAKEFTSLSMIALMNKSGVTHQTTSPGCSFSNGAAERAHLSFQRQVELHLNILSLPSRVDIIPWLCSSVQSALNLHRSDAPPQFMFGDPITFVTPTDLEKHSNIATLSPTRHRRGVFLGYHHSGRCEVLSCTDDGLLHYEVHPNSVNLLPSTDRKSIIESISRFNNTPVTPTKRQRRRVRRMLGTSVLEKHPSSITDMIAVSPHTAHICKSIIRSKQYPCTRSQVVRRKGAGTFFHGYGYVADDEAHPDDVINGLFDEADAKEFKSIHDNNVLELFTDQPSMVPIRTRFRRTWKIMGATTKKAKSRFLVCAHADPRDVQTTTSVPGMADRRLFDIKGLSMGYKSATIDVKTAFLLVPLDVDVFVRLPAKLPNAATDLGYICNGTYRLRKSLYGLKESPRLFNNFLAEKLSLLGWKLFKPGLFYQGDNIDNPKALLTAYVDDLKCWSNDPVSDLEAIQTTGIPCSDLLPITKDPQRHVGEDISIHNNVLYKDISTYIANMHDHIPAVQAAANSTRHLVSENLHKLEKFSNPAAPDDLEVHLMQQVVGQLTWIGQCHPGIATRASMLASFTHRPSPFLFKCTHGVLRELSQEPLHPLLYVGTPQPELRVWVDAAIHDHHSRRGWVVQIANKGDAITSKNNLIDWKSSAIKAVTFASSTAAEIYALEKMLLEVLSLVEDIRTLFPNIHCRILTDSNSGLKRIQHDMELTSIGGQIEQILQGLRLTDGYLEHVSGDIQLADAQTKIKATTFYS